MARSARAVFVALVGQQEELRNPQHEVLLRGWMKVARRANRRWVQSILSLIFRPASLDRVARAAARVP